MPCGWGGVTQGETTREMFHRRIKMISDVRMFSSTGKNKWTQNCLQLNGATAVPVICHTAMVQLMQVRKVVIQRVEMPRRALRRSSTVTVATADIEERGT